MELQKGMTAWVKRALKEGRVYPREICEIDNGKIYFSKYRHIERGFLPDELITDEIQALEIALDARRNQRDDLDEKILDLKKRRSKAIQKKALPFVRANGKRLEEKTEQKEKIKATA